ncbi:MAG: phosphoribosylglycinamide formyltransferase [Thermoanaerobacteraceae bacterium]|uniref:phosphoribosylglycinamide formyltransferase n=1 Tax=Thermanaeromonas sp. C210 TaxID=2731925 RepID=UPI00155D2548|nr:phosphoribosylglycinamide formyltransferase [Thermanaeromonas sp. C210]MBE3581233.1 phosphoribosylglycinamide formyltransferase [Thermoanaerobacteraceae bacterium]GFN22196.1 phosphoribosylglycinamide formyltransferase [Thermanaeromonas sp. C210]
MSLPIGVLASGRGSNLEAIIRAREAGELPVELKVVISDKREARALRIAAEHGIPAEFLDPRAFPDRVSYDLALAARLKEAGVELVVLAGFMRILSPAFLEQFPLRVINIHPALLPAFPGLEAQRQAWEYGVKISGCTVHFVDVGVDTGPIIAQAAVTVEDGDTPETLAERILEQEHRLLPEAIRWIAQGRVRVQGRRVYVEK